MCGPVVGACLLQFVGLRLRLRLDDDVCGRVDSSGKHGPVSHERQRADGGGGGNGHRGEQKGAEGVAEQSATADCTEQASKHNTMNMRLR